MSKNNVRNDLYLLRAHFVPVTTWIPLLNSQWLDKVGVILPRKKLMLREAESLGQGCTAM